MTPPCGALFSPLPAVGVPCWPLVVMPWAFCGPFCPALLPLTNPPEWWAEPWLESWLEIEPRVDSSSPGELGPESLSVWWAGVFTVAACCTLWLSGWEATCVEDFGSIGVALTGATDPPAVVTVTAGALALGATFGLTDALLGIAPLANDGAGAENVDAAGTTEFDGPPCQVP